MHFFRDADYFCDMYRRLKFSKNLFLRRESYEEPTPKPTMVYTDKVYERSAPSFGVAEQPYRHIQQQEFEQHITQATSHTGRFQTPDMPVAEGPSVELDSVSDAELIEMAIDAVKDDTVDGQDDMGFEDNGQENVEEAFDGADEPFDDPFEGPSIENMIGEPFEDPMANDMPDEMDEMQEMDDPQQIDPYMLYMPFGGNPFGG